MNRKGGRKICGVLLIQNESMALKIILYAAYTHPTINVCAEDKLNTLNIWKCHFNNMYELFNRKKLAFIHDTYRKDDLISMNYFKN